MPPVVVGDREAVPLLRLTNKQPTSGARGTRTPDLLGAIQALFQLSYSPARRMVAAAQVPATGRKPPALDE